MGIPETSYEARRRANEEIANFTECGDRRGLAWLNLEGHEAEKQKAEEFLAEWKATVANGVAETLQDSAA